MLYFGTDPESCVTEYTSVYENKPIYLVLSTYFAVLCTTKKDALAPSALDSVPSPLQGWCPQS
jgi:hypothetical protein